MKGKAAEGGFSSFILCPKGIDNADAAVVLPVIEVFGVEGVAAQLQSGCENGGIPVFNLKPLLQGKCLKDLGFRRHGTGKLEEKFCRGYDGVWRLPQPGFVQAGIDELLNDLTGESEVARGDKPGGSRPLFGIIWSMGDGIDEDVGIVKDAHAHLPSCRS